MPAREREIFKLQGCTCPDPDCGTKALEGIRKLYELALILVEKRLKSGDTIPNPFAEAFYCVHEVGAEYLVQERIENFKQTIGQDLIEKICDRAKEEIEEHNRGRKDTLN